MSSVTTIQLLAVTEVLKAYEYIPVPRCARCSGKPQVYWQSAMPCFWSPKLHPQLSKLISSQTLGFISYSSKHQQKIIPTTFYRLKLHFENTSHFRHSVLLTYSKSGTQHILYCCFTLDAGLLARSQYPEGPATGHLDIGFSWFPCVYKGMLRWFPNFQVATTCFSCSPPDLNFLVTYLIFVYM
jgi:hypothetical protein